MRDWRDEERDRRIDEMYDRQTGTFDDIWEFVVWIAIGFAVLLGAAGLLDNFFGWGLVDWLWGLLHQWTGGAIGRPSE